jgi:hypothetical protein
VFVAHRNHRGVDDEKDNEDPRRATRKHYSSEEKIRIVLDGLRGEDSIAELCRREGISQGIKPRQVQSTSPPLSIGLEKPRRFRKESGLNENLGRHESATGPLYTALALRKLHGNCSTRSTALLWHSDNASFVQKIFHITE